MIDGMIKSQVQDNNNKKMPRALGKQPANCSWGKKTREDMKTMDTLRYDSYLSDYIPITHTAEKTDVYKVRKIGNEDKKRKKCIIRYFTAQFLIGLTVGIQSFQYFIRLSSSGK